MRIANKQRVKLAVRPGSMMTGVVVVTKQPKPGLRPRCNDNNEHGRIEKQGTRLLSAVNLQARYSKLLGVSRLTSSPGPTLIMGRGTFLAPKVRYVPPSQVPYGDWRVSVSCRSRVPWCQDEDGTKGKKKKKKTTNLHHDIDPRNPHPLSTPHLVAYKTTAQPTLSTLPTTYLYLFSFTYLTTPFSTTELLCLSIYTCVVKPISIQEQPEVSNKDYSIHSDSSPLK